MIGAKNQEPERFEVEGTPLICQICDHDLFWHRRSQLNTAAATFFGMDWANRRADCFVCDRCHYVHWFLDR